MLNKIFKAKTIYVGSGEEKEIVLLFKGLGRREKDLEIMANYLHKDHDYAVAIIGHSNSLETFDQSAKTCIEKISKLRLNKFNKVHLLGVSRGGLVIRRMLERGLETQLTNLGRVVMLGTPNQGSHFAVKMSKTLIMHGLTRLTRGPSAIDTRTDHIKKFLKNHFPSKTLELGIIAAFETGEILGAKRYSWLPEWMVPADNNTAQNDGTVTVEETKLDGMKEHIILENLDHIEMETDKDPIDQAVHFLRNGTFKKPLEKNRTKKPLADIKHSRLSLAP